MEEEGLQMSGRAIENYDGDKGYKKTARLHKPPESKYDSVPMWKSLGYSSEEEHKKKLEKNLQEEFEEELNNYIQFAPTMTLLRALFRRFFGRK